MVGVRMNKSVMKCCICNNENIGQFITINNKKYHLCCIEQLQQENQELKSQLKGTTHCFDEEEHEKLNGTIQTYDILLKANVEENKQLKDNWNELKEWVDKCYDYYTNEKDYIGGRLCFIDMKDKMQELEGDDK